MLSERTFRLVMFSAVAALGLLSYSNTLNSDFVWDDVSSILVHEGVRDPSQFFQLFREDQHAYMGGQGNFYRPLVSASFMADYALSHRPPANRPEPRVAHPSPFFFHLSSVLWHVAACLALFMVLTLLGAPRFVRAIVPAVYVAHPLHTEAVAYISGRADSMSAAFMFLALALAVWNGEGKKRVVAILLSTASFAAALISKESSAIFPGLLFLVLFCVGRDDGRRDFRSSFRRATVGAVPALITLIVYGALRLTVLNFQTESQTPPSGFGGRFVEAGQALFLYVKLLVVPTNLHMERSLEGVPGWYAFPGFLLVVAFGLMLALSYARGQWRLTIGSGWFLLTWIPISGLFPLNAPMAEHWMYVPMAGFFWVVAELLWLARPSKGGAGLIALPAYAFCLVLLALSIRQNMAWRDNETLYRAILEERGDSLRANFNLAATYEDLLGNDAGARRHYQRTLDIYQSKKERSSTTGEERFWDQELESHLSLGRLYSKERRLDVAARHFGTVLRMQPTERTLPLIQTASGHMAELLLGAGDYAGAARLLGRVLGGGGASEAKVEGQLTQIYISTYGTSRDRSR